MIPTMSAKYLTAIILAGAALTASAQVNKEITVERDVVLTVREASPQTFNPTFTLPPVERSSLNYSGRVTTARIPALYSALGPVAVADSIAASPWRGYASAGYFPAINIGASAGYRIIDGASTTLDAWLQYDGSRYNASYPSTLSATDKVRHGIISHDVALGLRLVSHLSRGKLLNLAGTFDYGRFNAEPFLATGKDRQSATRADVSALFMGPGRELGYSIGLDYSLFKFGKGYDESDLPSTPLHPVTENRFGLTGTIFAMSSDISKFQLDISASALRRSEGAKRVLAYDADSFCSFPGYLTTADSHLSGLIDFNPTYRLASDKFSLRLGLRLALSFSDGALFNVTPDVKATWTPVQAFAVYARATGGVHQNTMGSLYEIDRFACPVLAYGNSRVPLDAGLGFRVGPFRGASLTLEADWAKAKKWLMPYGETYGLVYFGATDVKGWMMKAAIDYSWRRLAKLSLSASLYPQDRNGDPADIYYTNLDHARYTLGAELTVNPLKKLEVTAGYQLRARRRMSAMITGTAIVGGERHQVSEFKSRDMDNISDLHIGGVWSFTPTLSVFLRAENILCRKTASYDLIPGQSIHGLAGVAYKF